MKDVMKTEIRKEAAIRKAKKRKQKQGLKRENRGKSREKH